MTESGQLDVVAFLSDQLGVVEEALATLDTSLRPQIDANPEDNLLMDLLGYVDDAEQALKGLRDTLQTIEQRDLNELP